MIMREEIFKYVKKKYGTEPDYPLPTAQDFPVLRHEDNRKWFAIIMDVPREKLGLEGTERVDVLNVKMGDSMLADILTQQTGYFRGYHISRGNWISILLDGTVPFEDICKWIDESYVVTASKLKKQKIRPPKRYKPDQFTFDKLKGEYGIFAIRGPRGIPHSLSEALKK